MKTVKNILYVSHTGLVVVEHNSEYYVVDSSGRLVNFNSFTDLESAKKRADNGLGVE